MSTAASEFSQNAQSFTVVTGSDSIYFDFLLGTGALGLLCIILCFRNCWMLADFRRVPMEAAYLKAGMLGAFCFGLATVSPASFSVAPFFFTVAGLAGCVRRDYSLNEARRA
jgi:O-antigen ligase